MNYDFPVNGFAEKERIFMKYILRISILLLLISIIHSCSKDDIEDPEPEPPEEDSLQFPEKEMRGVWMATVWELDWPKGNHDPESQKELYLAYLDQFQSLNINTVF